MDLTRFITPCGATLLLFAATASAEPKGVWLNEAGNLEIEIVECGPNLCGLVEWIAQDQPAQDVNNPDPTLRQRPMVGLRILEELAPDGEDTWKGEIYNRVNGKTYRCKMRVLGPDRLEIRGYIGLPLFGASQVWTRRELGDTRS